MAIYWVDPYIESVAAGATGTTSLTIRNGTYASPLRFSDIYSTSASVAPTYNGLSFAAGDEIRIKGLTDAQWKIALSDQWALFTDSVQDYRFKSQTKNQVIPAAYLGTSATKKSIFWVDNCPGFGGEEAFFASYALTDDGTFYTLNGQTTWWIGYSYPAMGTAPFSASLVNYDYALASPVTGYWLFQNLAANVSITDGWVNETTRTGKTWWIFTFGGTNTVYLGHNNAGNAGTAYTIDLANSYFANSNSSSQTLQLMAYVAINQTMNLGGVSGAYGSSNGPLYLYYSSGSVFSIKTVTSSAGQTNKTAWSGTPINSTITLRNFAGSYYSGLGGSSYAGETLKLRCLVAGFASWTPIPAVSGMTVEFLAGAIIRPFLASAVAMFSGALPGTFLGVTPARSFTGMPSAVAAYAGQPSVGVLTSLSAAADSIYSGAVVLDGVFFRLQGYTMNAQYNLEDVYRWAMLTDGRDYRLIDVGTGSNSVVTGEAARGIHFASNSFDTRPLALIFSAAGKAIFIYNEAAQNNALTFQSATAAAGENFWKRLPLDLPAYAAGNGVRLDFEYATSAAFTTGEMGLYLVGINGSTGTEVIEPLLGGAGQLILSGAQTVVTTAQYTIPKSWLTNNAITQMQAKLRFKSGTGVGKFFIRAMTLTNVP